MRNNFIKQLINAAREDNKIYLICGDIGFSVLEPFEEEFPERFINAGISEQNMIGIAAGLALCGRKVFVYSIVQVSPSPLGTIFMKASPVDKLLHPLIDSFDPFGVNLYIAPLTTE